MSFICRQYNNNSAAVYQELWLAPQEIFSLAICSGWLTGYRHGQGKANTDKQEKTCGKKLFQEC